MDFKLLSNVGYDNISSEFDFQGPGLKVKSHYDIFFFFFFFLENFVIALVPHLLMDFNVSSHKCWVW